MDIDDSGRFIGVIIHVLNANLLFEYSFETDIDSVNELGGFYPLSLVELMRETILVEGNVLVAVLVLFA
jgi:hypothetical protein